eukprot:TRINITY_DN45113_c0_g2_i1.p1 TRINITY_DN45113_c0_g2~~TRINITY_DN45113_c0_g2_i1.p1  ORF type:complete len:144 (+),score=5.45 TRINITY_DN45113_c0_g2_i1:1-432(+)
MYVKERPSVSCACNGRTQSMRRVHGPRRSLRPSTPATRRAPRGTLCNLQQNRSDHSIQRSSCLPYAVSTWHRAAIKRSSGCSEGELGSVPAVRMGKTAVIDGERLLSRPGPYLADATTTLAEILNSDAREATVHQGSLWKFVC